VPRPGCSQALACAAGPGLAVLAGQAGGAAAAGGRPCGSSAACG